MIPTKMNEGIEKNLVLSSVACFEGTSPSRLLVLRSGLFISFCIILVN